MGDFNHILEIDENSQIKYFKKGEILQAEGQKNSLVYYVKKGLLRSYTIDNKGKEHIITFASEGWLISNVKLADLDQTNKVFIDCIEHSEVIVFDKKHFDLSKLTNLQLEENTRLLERRIAVLERRVIMLMSASAKDRYNKFLKTHPELPNRVPQRMIASYLGITPQSLSTIKGEIARKS